MLRSNRLVPTNPFVMITFIIMVAIPFATVGCDSGSDIDALMNTANVAQHLRHDENYPFVGFWKRDPEDNSGLVLNVHRDGGYSVWSCSPRSSVEVESLSPTTLTDDDNFNIIDENTIEVRSKSGTFEMYVRVL